MRVVVVGAGLAGLGAAWLARRAGHEVVVLEARDRVGGRTWSHELRPGVVVERGGEWIDADQHTIRWFCASLGLPVVPHGLPFHRRRVGRRLPSLSDLARTLDRVRAAIPPEDCSLAQAFEAALGQGYADDPAFLRMATSCAGDPTRASARANVACPEAAYLDGAGRVAGGNQRICQAMAADLGDVVRLGTPVATVAVEGDRAAVTVAGGEMLAADRVVVAVPLALLDRIEWEPGFPDPWRDGLCRVETGHAAKLSAPGFARRPRGIQQPGETWWTWNSLDPSGRASYPAVSAFAGGDAARTLGAGGADTWARRVADLRHDRRLATDHALLTDWNTDEWSRGGYSYVLAGRTAHAAALLQRAAGPLVLAGEFTDPDDPGTMNGALASAVRAARSLAE